MPFSYEELKRQRLNNSLMSRFNPMIKPPENMQDTEVDEILKSFEPLSTNMKPEETIVPTTPSAIDKTPEIVPEVSGAQPAAQPPKDYSQLGYIGAGFAGLGDAMSRAAGANTNYFGESMHAIKRGQEETSRKNPLSPANVAMRATLKKQGIDVADTDTIDTVAPLLEAHKLKTERMKAETVKQGEPPIDPIKLESLYHNEKKDFDVAQGAMDRLNAVKNQKTVPGDTALLFSYMKLANPTMSTRPGQEMTAEDINTFGGKFSTLYAQTIAGKRLSDDDRKRFIDTSESLYEAGKKKWVVTDKHLRNLGKTYGIDTNLWLGKETEGTPTGAPVENVPNFASEEEASAADLPVGTKITINGRAAEVR